MVPRYVRVVAEIPKTETNKTRKVVFRDQGVTPDTWDRERAGIKPAPRQARRLSPGAGQRLRPPRAAPAPGSRSCAAGR